jgi:hypothetical protein
MSSAGLGLGYRVAFNELAALEGAVRIPAEVCGHDRTQHRVLCMKRI